MNPESEVKAVAFSEKVFRRLLAAYPQAHREEYGGPMAQLFRDQCRDAWNESRGWGLTKLWLRVLPDMVATSFSEHLEAIKQRKFMLNRIGSVFRSVQFVAVFAAVFLLVVITATIVTFILPETFAGTARVVIRKSADSNNAISGSTRGAMADYDPYFVQTEFEIMQSQVVLAKVVEKLNLNVRWGIKFRGSERLTIAEATDLLKHSLELRPVRNTSLIEIRTYSDKPDEAAELANGVAEAYKDFCFQQNLEPKKNRIAGTQQELEKNQERVIADSMVTILDRAVPNIVPIRPNKPLNITLGVILGIVLGLIAAGGVAGVSFLWRRNVPPTIAK